MLIQPSLRDGVPYNRRNRGLKPTATFSGRSATADGVAPRLGASVRAFATGLISALGGLAPEPFDVSVVGLIAWTITSAFDWRHGPFVFPFVDFRMTISKSKATGSIVVTGRAVR